MKNFSDALGFSRAAGTSLRAARRQPRTPILLYHRFGPKKPVDPWTVTTRVFEEQLQWLCDHHYRVVPLRPVVDALRGNGPPVAQPAVTITVDDGDRTVYTEMFPVIRRYGVPVTLFVCPAAISRSADALTWRELEIMVRSGLVDVQFHTLSHPDFKHERKRRRPADYQAFVEYELSQARETVENRLSLTVDMLAWPYGIYDSDLEEAAADAGYAIAFAVKTKSRSENSLFAVPRISVHNRHRGDRLRARIAPGRPFQYFRRARSFAHAVSGFVMALAGDGATNFRATPMTGKPSAPFLRTNP